jgi:hypothetical protein
MSIAIPPLRQTKLAAAGSRKRFSEVRAFNADVSLHVKFNPDWAEGLTPGVAALAATVEVDATNIILEVDAASDRNVAHATKSVQTLIDEINATQSDGTNRWRAGLGDVRPGVVTTPLVLSAANSLLGYLGSVSIIAAATTLHLAVGTDRSNRGEGYRIPDAFNTLYDYPLTRLTGGLADPLPSQVGRGGGVDSNQGEDILPQRRSAFRNSPAARAREINPSASRFLTVVDAITNNALATTGTLLQYTLTEEDGNVVWSQEELEAVTFIDVPSVVCRGPAYLTVVGDTGAAFTAGEVGMTGDIRVA